MTQYSQYSETNIMTPLMYLRIITVVGGQYIDYSGNGYHATAVTIVSGDDGISLANNDTLRDYIRNIGLFDLFYDTDGTPLEVFKSHIGRIYNNVFFDNDSYILLCSEPLTGLSLTATCNDFFGVLESESQSIITACGVTSELEQRLIDTHIKDLKSINLIQSDFFKFGDPDNSVLKVLYGIIGNAFNSVKYNWINPVDTDAGNRLSLVQGEEAIILNNLINFDGRGCYNTHFNASLKLGTPNHFSYLSPFNLADGDIGKDITATNDSYELGCLGTSGSYKGISLAVRRDDASHVVVEDTYQNPTKGISSAEINSKALYFVNKQAADSLKAYKDNTQLGSTVTDSGDSVYYNGNVILGNASIDGVITTAKNTILPCGYFSIGSGIDSGALVAFQDAVLRFASSKIDFFFPPDETARV